MKKTQTRRVKAWAAEEVGEHAWWVSEDKKMVRQFKKLNPSLKLRIYPVTITYELPRKGV